MATTIGIDLGGTKVLAVRMVNNDVVDMVNFSTPGGADELKPAALDAARKLWADDVEAVGIGIAGLVSWPSGVFVWGPHVAGTNVAVRAELESELGLSVGVDNDATNHGWLSDKCRCDCGKIGCWETVASGPALVRLTKEFVAQNPEGSLAHHIGDEPITGETVTRAADAGFESARGLVAQVGADFGRGLCNLIAIFDPDMIVIGGGLGSVGESILGPARRTAADALHGGAHRMLPPILVAGLGPSAGAVGAALLAEDVATGRLTLGAP